MGMQIYLLIASMPPPPIFTVMSKIWFPLKLAGMPSKKGSPFI
jgi:hypothetical protein